MARSLLDTGRTMACRPTFVVLIRDHYVKDSDDEFRQEWTRRVAAEQVAADDAINAH